MPLIELMRYFNDQFKVQAESRHMPNTGFYFADNQYWARFGSQIFGSYFRPVYRTRDQKILGYDCALKVRTALGNIITADEVFDALTNLDDLVFLDRVTRALQTLNFLQQFPEPPNFLSLSVQPRNMMGMTHGEGITFEAILHDCGLSKAEMLLHSRLTNYAELMCYRPVFLGYRDLGYLLGVQIHRQSDWELLRQWNVQPDYLYLYPGTFVPGNFSLQDSCLAVETKLVQVMAELTIPERRKTVYKTQLKSFAKQVAENAAEPEYKIPARRLADDKSFWGFIAE